MAKKIVLFVVGYFVWIGLFMLVGMNALNNALADKASPFNDTTGPIVLIIGALVVFGAPVIIFLFWFYHTPKWEKDLQATGILAPARVLEVKDTGVSTGSRYNSTPWYRVKLQVQPANNTPFEVVLEKSSNELYMVRQGSTVNVKYDPDNKKHVVIAQANTDSPSTFSSFSYTASPVIQVSGKQPSASGSNVAQQLIDLAKLHQSGELTDEEFEAMKKQLFS